MVRVYGISNCDSVKKARKWLEQHGVQYDFHDFKKSGLEQALLLGWIGKVGWSTLLNRRGMMWRKLPQATRDNIDSDSAVGIMLDTPTIIKRPVLDLDGRIEVGFSEQRYSELFD
jgi:arsenate reductase